MDEGENTLLNYYTSVVRRVPKKFSRHLAVKVSSGTHLHFYLI